MRSIAVKKTNTLKSQIAVHEASGAIVDISESVPGPTADIRVLEQSGLMKRLPEGVGGMGDLAYISNGLDTVTDSKVSKF